MINKERCWRALQLAFWLNDHSDFFFNHIHGDKETFHLAWRKLKQEYTMAPTPIHPLEGTMCQHDLRGNRLFQHRNFHKWKAFEANKRVSGFLLEDTCLGFVHDLEKVWDGKIHLELAAAVRANGFTFRGGTCDQSVFHDVCEKNEYGLPGRFKADALIIDIGAHIGSFSYACVQRGARRVLAFEPEPENFRLAKFNLHPFRRSVRLTQKAVWRSDRHPGWLLHSGYSQTDDNVNTGGGTVLLQPEDSPQHKRKELISTVSLDNILRPFKTVQLLKLDCEGSEWPILFTSKLLGKVEILRRITRIGGNSIGGSGCRF